MRSVLDLIEVHEDSELSDTSTTTSGASASSPAEPLVLVVHAAFAGVCATPDGLLLPWRNTEDAVGEPRRGLIRVSRSMLETDRLDPEVAQACNAQFDAVWVPSHFNAKTFSSSGVKPGIIHVLHEPFDPVLYTCSRDTPTQRSQAAFGMPHLDSFLAEEPKAGTSTTFTFLSVFKWETRKNWKALLEAFAEAFPNNVTEVTQEDGRQVALTVRLLIKTQELSWGTSPESDVEELFSEGSTAKLPTGRLLIIKDSLPGEVMPRLYHAADAFVLPTHGEGWGLPLMEAMASGLPAIATDWGGQTEFMNRDNAFMLGYELEPSDGNGHMWATPHASELREAMWDVLRRPGLARSKAERGCREVRERYKAETVAGQVVDLIAGLQRAFAA